MSRSARHRAPTKPLVNATGVRVALTTTGALAAVPVALLATAGTAQAYTDNGDGTVTVERGDTISAIAQGTGQHTQAVLDRNDLGWRTTIHPGQRVTLPGHGGRAAVPAQRTSPPSRSAERAPLPASTASVHTASAGTAPVNTTGEAATALARHYVGTPYVWGGASPAAGFDCSGLVQYVYGRLGVSLPRTSGQMRSVGYEVSTPRVGDLVLFDDYGHVAIYAGDGQIVEAPKPGQVVHQRSLWTDRVQFRRVA